MDNSTDENISKPVRDGLFSVSDDLRVAGMQKMCALKQNDLLQEELDWQDISSIADNLYVSGHLEHHHLEQILDKSQPRRKAVDSLINAIIKNQSAVSVFIRILESESRYSYIAERIKSTGIESRVGRRRRRRYHLDSVDHLDSVAVAVADCLANCLDYSVADCLVGRLDYSVAVAVDSVAVADCPVGPVGLGRPVGLGLGRPVGRPVEFYQFYQYQFYQSVDWACDYPAAQKRMKIQESGSVAVKEKKMVKSLRIAIVGQKLWSQVGKHLDLEFKEAFKGPPKDEE